MQEVKPKWRDHQLVLVCERCRNERIPEEDPDMAARLSGFNLRDWLKARLKEDGHWGAVRVVNSSCLDVCARRKVTVAIASEDDRRIFAVDPYDDKETVYEYILQIVNRSLKDVRLAQSALE